MIIKFYKNQYSSLSFKELFWEKVIKGRNYECWNWKGAKRTDGYGAIRKNNKILGAHRLSWKLHFGKIPKNKLVCHFCDNRLCVNPKHLFLGSSKDNVRDAIEKNRVPQLSGNNWKL